MRARAVRLLREAAAVGLCGGDGGDSIGMNSGELAFTLECAAMKEFGAGQARYFEFVSRIAALLKVCTYCARACDIVYVQNQEVSNFIYLFCAFDAVVLP